MRMPPPFHAISGVFGRLSAKLSLLTTSMVMVTATLCGGCADREPGKPVDGLVEAILFGGGRCLDDSECVTGLCSIGQCMGFLTAASDATRDQVGGAITKFLEQGVADDLRRFLVAVLADRASEPFVRGRTADLYRFLPAEWAEADLSPMLDDDDEMVRFFAARAMTLKSSDKGYHAIAAFLEHESAAIRAMAETAIEDRPQGQRPVKTTE